MPCWIAHRGLIHRVCQTPGVWQEHAWRWNALPGIVLNPELAYQIGYRASVKNKNWERRPRVPNVQWFWDLLPQSVQPRTAGTNHAVDALVSIARLGAC